MYFRLEELSPLPFSALRPVFEYLKENVLHELSLLSGVSKCSFAGDQMATPAFWVRYPWERPLCYLKLLYVNVSMRLCHFAVSMSTFRTDST